MDNASDNLFILVTYPRTFPCMYVALRRHCKLKIRCIFFVTLDIFLFRKLIQSPPDLRSILHSTNSQGLQCQHQFDDDDAATYAHSPQHGACAHTPQYGGLSTTCQHEIVAKIEDCSNRCGQVDQATMTDSWMDQYSSDSELGKLIFILNFDIRIPHEIFIYILMTFKTFLVFRLFISII